MKNVRQKVRSLIRAMTHKAGVTVSGVNISGNYVGGNLVIGDHVTIDGVNVSDLRGVGPVTIIVEGSIEKLHVSAGVVTINGDGGYNLYYKTDDQGEVIAALIVFIGDSCEEEDDE